MPEKDYKKAQFLLSAAKVNQLPEDSGTEVALVGRSNAGKSSVLNCMTHMKGLARVSKTPGRTQLINIFTLDDHRRIIDLPGYGFANVPLSVKEKWQQTVDAYIQHRESLKGLLLIMDVRHPLRPLDEQLLTYCDHAQLPVHILLNKADKLSNNAAHKVLESVKKQTQSHFAVSSQLFSAAHKTGLKILYILLDQWYGYPP